METRIDIGFDPGYAFIKTAVEFDGALRYDKDNTVVVALEKPTSQTIFFEGQHWMVGYSALKRQKHIEITNHELLERFAPILFLHMLKRNGIEPESVGKVATGLSLAHEGRIDSFKSRLSSFVANEKEYSFNVHIVPQAEGARHTIEGIPDKPENYAIFDIGGNTLDVLVVIDGELQEDSRFGADNRGVFQVAKSLQQVMTENKIETISLPTALAVLETSTIRLNGEDYDLSEEVDKIKSSYTQELMAYIAENWRHEIKVLDQIVFVGGGSYLLEKEQMLPHYIVPEYPEYYNAVGNLMSIKVGVE